MKKLKKFITGLIIIAFLSTVIIIVKRIPHKGKETPNIFEEFMPLETESESFVISRVTKIGFSDGKIFIFDQRQKKIFVFSESFAFLYTIGSQGQGPGELDDPVDFAVCFDRIVVLERFPRRLNVFSLNGNFIQRINLKIPKEISYSYPSAILPGPDSTYLIAYSLSDHLLDEYDTEGNLKRVLLKREEPIILYKKNIGNGSIIGLYRKGKSILYFNRLDGEFIEIYPDGTPGQIFRVPDPFIQKISSDLRSSIAGESTSSSIQTDIIDFILFTNFCIDDQERIYVAQLRQSKEKQGQKIWICDPDHKWQYIQLSLPAGEKVKGLYFWNGNFYFLSDQERIWITKRRAK